MHGVLIASGGAIKPATRAAAARIVDVAPTMLYLAGETVPGDMDGHVLNEIVSDEYIRSNPVRFSEQTDDGQSGQVEFSAEENADIIERLKNLGYIG
jgi:hypothetical protein